ncbi:MAG TPA: TetR/AcrR family transcriptional regulator [Clostridia bacterium]|nr:TetR/AcrR family transcriptional regulator [Clostridia bacterium]
MSDKADSNKMVKENALINAAFELFSKSGINGTAIDEIVKKAGVAKGTFYLYFKDKYDILDRIVIKKSAMLIQNALTEMSGRKFDSGTDKILFFINYIIDTLTQSRILLKILYKNLSLGLYRRVMDDPVRGAEFRQIVGEFNRLREGGSKEENGYLLFILLEMTGSVCYSAILYGEPAPIDQMKPILLKTVRKILS